MKEVFKMKKTVLLAFSFLLYAFSVTVKAQTPIVSDPVLTAAVALETSTERGVMQDIENIKKEIAGTQAGATAAMGLIQNFQNKLLTGLTTVAPYINNIYQLTDCLKALNDGFTYESLMVKEAAKNPVAAAWAAVQQPQLETRAIAIYMQIAAMIMNVSGDNLMNAGQRTILLNKILDDLNSIKRLAQNYYYAVCEVVQVGLIKSAMPSFINNDEAIIKQTLSNFKF